MSAISKIMCHQYATGRASTGYGSVYYSVANDHTQEPTYQFSLTKEMGLRFSRLPDDVDCVLEIEPASRDFLHTGAILSRTREEDGSVSVYTHILISDEAKPFETAGLLRKENFLTPDEFTEVTQGKRTLAKTEKDSILPTEREKLEESQLERLGEFLARYWSLLDQREWPARDKPEIALVVPFKTRDELIAFFANEVIRRLPKYVQQSVSASFGTRWDNRGVNPCVCCVLPDNAGNPYPCYNIGVDGRSFTSRPKNEVEPRIGRILIKGDSKEYPKVYLRIEETAGKDDRFRAMARSYSTMAFSVQAMMAMENAAHVDPLPVLRKVYDSLTQLAEKRYRIPRPDIQRALLPLSEDILACVNKRTDRKAEDIEQLIRERIAFQDAGLHFRELSALDTTLAELIDKTQNQEEKISYLWTLYQGLNNNPPESEKALQPITLKLLQAVGNQGKNAKADSIRKAAIINCNLGRCGSEGSETKPAAEKILATNLLTWLKESNCSTGADQTTEKYNTDHYHEIVRLWLNGDSRTSENAAFDNESWTIKSLDEAIKSIAAKLSQCPQHTEADIFALLKKAERKLLDLHEKTTGVSNTVESAFHQCIRLSAENNDQAKALANEYRQYLCRKENRIALYAAIEKNKDRLAEYPALLTEILNQIIKDTDADEKEITGFLNAAQMTGNSEILKTNFPKLVYLSGKITNFSPEGYKTVTEYILRQGPAKEYIEDAFAIGLQNPQQSGPYINSLIDGTMRSPLADDTDTRKKLLILLEECAKKKIKAGNTDEAIRFLLGRENNRLPGQNLEHCRPIAEDRLKEALEKFILSAETIEPSVLEGEWEKGNGKRYSCRWTDLKKEHLEPIVNKKINQMVDASGDKIKLLTSMWDSIRQRNNDTYSTVLESQLTEMLSHVYDTLWKAARNKENAEKDRQQLDAMLDESLQGAQDQRLSNEIQNTTAWKARKFLDNLRDLSRRGMDKNPAEAGKLIETIKKAGGFEQCLSIGETEHDAQDDLYGLVMMIIRELAGRKYTGDAYWGEVLAGLRFDDKTDPWSDDGIRMLNKLSFITSKLESMNVPELARELSSYLESDYLNRLWNEKINKEKFSGAGEQILSGSLIRWILNKS